MKFVSACVYFESFLGNNVDRYYSKLDNAVASWVAMEMEGSASPVCNNTTEY